MAPAAFSFLMAIEQAPLWPVVVKIEAVNIACSPPRSRYSSMDEMARTVPGRILFPFPNEQSLANLTLARLCFWCSPAPNLTDEAQEGLGLFDHGLWRHYHRSSGAD